MSRPKGFIGRVVCSIQTAYAMSKFELREYTANTGTSEEALNELNTDMFQLRMRPHELNAVLAPSMIAE